MSGCKSPRLFLVALLAALFCLPVIAATVAPGAYIKANPRKDSSYFGSAVAVSGDTMVVGAYGDSSGVDGDEEDESKPSAGAAYVFVRSGDTWVQQAYLKASNPDQGDCFGISVAIDGDTIVVGASEEASTARGINGDQGNNEGSLNGAVYVFARNGTSWSQQAYLKTDNTNEFSRLGYSVSISGDTIVAGAVSESSFPDGNYVDQSQAAYGAAYVFRRIGVVWSQEARLIAHNSGSGDSFGSSVAVSGDSILVGAYGEASNAVSINGDESNNDAQNAGAAYVFVRNGGTWTQQAYLKAPNTEAGDAFGSAVALSGDTAIVGAPGEASGSPGINGNGADNSKPYSGAAYAFVRSGGTWKYQSYLKAVNPSENASFGASVSVSGGIVLVGAGQESSIATGVDGNPVNSEAAGSGAAYVFARNAGAWNQIAYLKSFAVNEGAALGTAVALSQGTIVAGAPYERYVLNGPIHQVFNYAGAAYTYSIAIPALDFQSRVPDPGQFSFSFTSTFEANFSVLATGDLSGEWTVLGTARKAASGRYEFNDSTAGSVSSRFYRLRMDY